MQTIVKWILKVKEHSLKNIGPKFVFKIIELFDFSAVLSVFMMAASCRGRGEGEKKHIWFM